MAPDVTDQPRPSSFDDSTHLRVKKSPNAFRTISEVADELHIPQHVLRFWETKFSQVKPLKRGGGRRYYRPSDIVLLQRIADLLYTQGYTIKGVQRLLREGGGQLSDDIPPPTADERAAADAEIDTCASRMPQLIPDLELVPPSTGSTESIRQPPKPKPLISDRQFRALLQGVLHDLELLRAIVDPNEK